MKKKKFLTTGSLFKIEQDDEKILLSALHKLSIEEQEAVKNILSKLDEANEKISQLDKKIIKLKGDFIENLTGEIWRDVIGYEGIYQVSNKGRVKSFCQKKIKLLKPFISKQGYLRVALSKNYNRKKFPIHRLVATAFIPNPNNKPEVNHEDGNKLNNCVENLKWVTSKENIRHAYDYGLKKNKSGYEAPNVKLTYEQVKFIRENYVPYDEKFGRNALAKKFNISNQTIWTIVNYKSYRDVE